MKDFVFRIVIILFGVLLPAYKSYKALKYKNVKDLVRLSMYWVVFAGFLTVEVVTDVILSWLPLYSELKLLLVIFLVLPGIQGASVIYRKLIHPQLCKNELEIDEALEKVTEIGCKAVVEFGTKGLSYAASTVISTALKGQDLLMNHLSHRSFSMGDLRGINKVSGSAPLGLSAQGDFTQTFELDNDLENPLALGDAGFDRSDGTTRDVKLSRFYSTSSLGRRRRSERPRLSHFVEQIEIPEDSLSFDFEEEDQGYSLRSQQVEQVIQNPIRTAISNTDVGRPPLSLHSRKVIQLKTTHLSLGNSRE